MPPIESDEKEVKERKGLQISTQNKLLTRLRFFERIITNSGCYFVSKFGWQEGWVNDYNQIILLDRPQDFTNNDYWELSMVFISHTQRQLFEAMQKMFALTPDDGEVGGRFNKFQKSIGKFWDDFKNTRCQPNFKEDFSC